ncbi:MAG: hypothetical protein PVI30_02705 [Myxococcales bacterium]|jgi:hypothetical protein
MRCEEAREALDLMPRETQPLALGQHLHHCAACQAYARHSQALDRILELDAQRPPRPGFDTRFFARLEEERRRRKRRRVWHWSWTLLPLGIGAVISLLRVPPPPPPAPEAATLPPDEMGLVMELELMRELELVRNLDDLEAFEVLSEVDEDELGEIAAEVKP